MIYKFIHSVKNIYETPTMGQALAHIYGYSSEQQQKIPVFIKHHSRRGKLKCDLSAFHLVQHFYLGFLTSPVLIFFALASWLHPFWFFPLISPASPPSLVPFIGFFFYATMKCWGLIWVLLSLLHLLSFHHNIYSHYFKYNLYCQEVQVER